MKTIWGMEMDEPTEFQKALHEKQKAECLAQIEQIGRGFENEAKPRRGAMDAYLAARQRAKELL